MAAANHSKVNRYYIPAPSTYPIKGSAALFLMGLGAAFLMNKISAGPFLLGAGILILLWMMFGWFGQVIKESEARYYNDQVGVSFRWSMGWFIFSEVMFFAAFFGALYYTRVFSLPDLAGPDQKLLWPDFTGVWPSSGPYWKDHFSPMAAWGIPAINTLILLTSGATLTVAHWGLLQGKRAQLNFWLLVTVLLGFVFMCFQIFEYSHAYSEMNLKLSTGIYGSTFFMLTGFHGFHVTVGAIMLAVMLGRSLSGHFDTKHHFAFEAAAWYWHFVDVVWVLLFVVVYWL